MVRSTRREKGLRREKEQATRRLRPVSSPPRAADLSGAGLGAGVGAGAMALRFVALARSVKLVTTRQGALEHPTESSAL
eukprot:1226564-Prymnesium_polylepis.1